MPKLYLRLFYDGRRYHGFQRQPDKETVEGILLSLLKRELNIKDFREIQYASASRTDRGVHALAQTIAFNVKNASPMDNENLISTLNNKLYDKGIIIWAYTINDLPYHPRYSALYREYIYVEPEEHYINISLGDLKDYASLFVGLHDFKYFSLKDKIEVLTMRRIDSIEVHKEYGFIVFKFSAKSFTRGLVRMIITCIRLLAYGVISQNDVRKMLSGIAVNHVRKLLKPAPAHNLILYNIVYPFSFKLLHGYWKCVIEYLSRYQSIPVFNYLYHYLSLNNIRVASLL